MALPSFRKPSFRRRPAIRCLAATAILVLSIGGPAPLAKASNLVFFVEAVRENRIDEVRELLRDGADVDAQDMFGGNTGLHWAARQGLSEMARLLLENGARVDARNDAGETPLHWAAAHGQKALLVTLIAYKANVNAIDRAGWTPLRWAEAQGQEQIARILVAAGGRR
jgi:ankyrin repeat protein